MTGDAPAGATALEAVARLVPLPPGLYAFALSGETGPRRGPGAHAFLAVELCASPHHAGTLEILDGNGRPSTWLVPDRILVVRSPPAGAAALATLYLAPGTAGQLPGLQVRPLDMPGPPLALAFDGDTAAALVPRPVSLEIAAYLSGRGELRFVDASWVGDGDPAASIESFALLPRDPDLARAIEYKGLPASGAETPWLSGGMPCGTPGGGIPLIGFAVRQRSGGPAGMRLDCEYSARFRSGAIFGPARNGAPCLSSAADPLCGMQLRVAARPSLNRRP